MGLAEGRAIEALQDTNLPALQRAIDEAACAHAELDIDWDSLAVDEHPPVSNLDYGQDRIDAITRLLEKGL
jgi:hypothetical protein